MRVLGQVEPSDARQLIASSDLVLSLSVGSEAGETLVVHEALGEGVPVLVVKDSAAAEWLEGFPAVICEPDGRAVAERILRMSCDLEGMTRLRNDLSAFHNREFRPVVAENLRIYESLCEIRPST